MRNLRRRLKKEIINAFKNYVKSTGKTQGKLMIDILKSNIPAITVGGAEAMKTLIKDLEKLLNSNPEDQEQNSTVTREVYNLESSNSPISIVNSRNNTQATIDEIILMETIQMSTPKQEQSSKNNDIPRYITNRGVLIEMY